MKIARYFRHNFYPTFPTFGIVNYCWKYTKVSQTNNLQKWNQNVRSWITMLSIQTRQCCITCFMSNVLILLNSSAPRIRYVSYCIVLVHANSFEDFIVYTGKGFCLIGPLCDKTPWPVSRYRGQLSPHIFPGIAFYSITLFVGELFICFKIFQL